MTLLSVEQARTLITTALDDTALTAVIEREEAMVLQRIGVPGDGTTEVTEIHDVTGRTLFVRLPILSVTSVSEDGTPLPATDYVIWPDEGRIKRDGFWRGAVVTVTYVPQDTAARWQAVMVELVRLALEQTAMDREEVTQEYRYQASQWEAKRERLYRRLNFLSV